METITDRRKTEQTMKARFDRVFSRCPGAWYGNPPTPTMLGTVTLDVTKVADAVLWLHRNGYTILRSCVSPREGAGAIHFDLADPRGHTTAPGGPLPITEETQAILRTQGKAAARQAHNDAVRREFEAAKEGAVISLSDLLASREALAQS